jgi:hypothetical protein
MESHEAGFPPFPHSLEIPSGFPHSHGLCDWTYVFSHRKGLVTDVSGPHRNACPGTLTGPVARQRSALRIFFKSERGYCIDTDSQGKVLKLAKTIERATGR